MEAFVAMLNRLRRYFFKLQPHMWLWELFSTLVALVSTIAILILLLCYDNRPLRDWSFYFTLNSVLSTFATVWQIAIGAAISPAIFQLGYVWFTRRRPLNDLEVFDNASRGIFGSLQMIWLQRFRGLASLCAFVIILLFFGETCIQQILTYPEKMVSRDSEAKIGRNTVYDEWIPGQEEDVKAIALSMVAAIMAGLYNTDSTSFAIKATCPTGNCTFPNLHTQAVGSKCSPIDSLVERTCHEKTSLQGCSFALPNGGPALSGNQALLNSTAVILDASHYNKSTMIFSQDPRQLATFQTISKAQSSSSSSSTKVKAMQCILYLCIKTYNVSVLNGNLSEKLVSTWTDSTFIGPGTPDWVSNPRTVPGGPYSLSYNSAVALQTYFWMLFSGSVIGSDEASIPSSDTMALFAELMSDDTLATRMDNLALSMTYHLRRWRALNSTSDNDENTVFGKAKEYQAYIHVTWLWFTMPASIPCLTLILLLSTMHSTQKNAISTFKSSPAALIFLGPMDRRRARFGRIEGLTQMRQMTQNFNFVIQNEGTGLRFVPRRRSTASAELI